MSEVRVGEWSGVENRRHKRVSLQVPIECRSEQRVLLAKAENLSVSGLLVRCTQPFPQDNEIAVSFTLPGATVPVSSKARVAHIVPGVFMGLELTGLSAESLQQINQFVAAARPVAKPK
ncbi:MAG: PilZ domain-containing protein [Acidobacteria bacterium]|nr:PilZ domain-containing protein [Acidobacteriota bacterium]